MKVLTSAAVGLSLAMAGVARAGSPIPVRRCLGETARLTDAQRSAPPLIQLAILLDTSNSMDGLIDQARSQLWKVVNELVGARRFGRAAELRVALYEYGNNRIPAAQGHVRQVLPFTADLDAVSERLFALTTLGGEEYCGTVLQASLDQLGWSPSPADLKVVFIAGNEPFGQGPVDYRQACARARAKGVVVNTIHCGSRPDGERTGWRDGAAMAYGLFSTIDQDRPVEHVSAPQDEEIARLGVELNKTYVPFGLQGKDGQARQQAQDGNAAKSGKGSATHRAVTKANRLYSNAGWDLVDAVRESRVDLGSLKASDLPEEMQGLSVAQRKTLIESRAKEREGIQERINELNRDRSQYIAQVRRAKVGADDSLDTAMTAALRRQAGCSGFELQ